MIFVKPFSLRIFVNKEITELVNGLIKSTKILEKNGFILVVSFNSIEDKIVKYFFNDLSKDQTVSRYLPNKDQKEKIFQLLNKKPIIPSPEEIKKNPASRSSKLRIAVKIKDTKNNGKWEMYNLIGNEINDLKNLIDDQKYSYHIYGKKNVKKGRKMGHFTKRS